MYLPKDGGGREKPVDINGWENQAPHLRKTFQKGN